MAQKGDQGAVSRWKQQQVHGHTAAFKPESGDTCCSLRVPGRWKNQGHCPTAQRATLRAREGQGLPKGQREAGLAQGPERGGTCPKSCEDPDPEVSQQVGQRAWRLLPLCTPALLPVPSMCFSTSNKHHPHRAVHMPIFCASPTKSSPSPSKEGGYPTSQRKKVRLRD